MSDVRELLGLTASIASDFVESLDERSVFPEVDVDELRRTLGGPLPDAPTPSRQVIAELARAAAPGITGMPSGRWFGFVLGGSVPAALAADWFTSARR